MEIKPFLQMMVQHEASDLYFSTGATVGIKVQGVTRPIGDKALTAESVKTLEY